MSAPLRGARRLGAWHAPRWLGPAAFLVVTALAIGTSVYGYFYGPKLEVVQFDAGNVNQFAIHRVVAYPEHDLYLVGLDNGGIRAIDGRVETSDCRVRWLPDDTRGASRNPAGLPGVFEDRCTGALWSFEGNAISGSEQPLRTPHVSPGISPDGRTQHVLVELVNPSR